jgi:mRNA-degrading endonuclease RelE of RelBE toxin-antitoxin system
MDLLQITPIRGVKEVVYKTRIKSSDNNKGKSGGFRVIYEVEEDKIIIHLIQVYSKSKKDNTSNTEIKRRLANK